MCDKKSDPVLTDYDITINSIHQENMFKGTITVCIVYAIFAFILVCAAYFSDNIRELLFDKFLPFTVVYIIGTIIIIMIFIYFILSFVPKKVDVNKIDDSISCPDYWKLEILDDKAIEKSFDIDNYNKKLFKYRCVMDDAVFNKGTIYKQDKNDNYPELKYRLGNKPAFIGSLNAANLGNGDSTNYNDLTSQSTTPLNSFLAAIEENNDKYYYLYKNMNAYNASNLNYTNNIYINEKIRNELKESALIMNNYKIDKNDKTKPLKYVDITNIGTNIYNSSDSTDLDNRYTKNYYNSPPILTWATSNAHDNTFTATAYRNTALDYSANGRYTSTVYDWSTMEDKTEVGKVYAVDTTGDTFKKVELGEIKLDSTNKNIYFDGNTSITVPSGAFSVKITNKIYYFDTTYISKDTLFTPTKANINTYKRGPKVRLFHKTERQPEILEANLQKENIPLVCSAVYPSFLASKEDKYAENNTLRCAYSKICNIPWSDLHCNEIALQ